MAPPSFITFSIFQQFPHLICAFSTRYGGESTGIYAAQNMGLNTGDDRQIVTNNRRRFFETVSIPEKQIAFNDQIHSSNVHIAIQPGIYRESDGLMTREKNLFLAVQTADCFPVFLFSSRDQMAAVIHAGWRGTKAGIVATTCDNILSAFHIQPENLYVAIGPGIQKECFEVGLDVSQYYPDQFLSVHTDPEKRYLDLAGFIKRTLIEHGIPDRQIEDRGICTVCDRDRFYSFRRDKQKSGRMIGIIGMRS
jgi:YfiH family protein